MRLTTFEDPLRRSRLGALAPDGRMLDLNLACALYLRDVENEGAFDRLADALVPPNMRDLFAGGDTSLEAARKALDYVLDSDSLSGAHGEPIFYLAEEIPLKAPIAPRKLFHPAGFRNVDAIIGHEQPVVFPQQLTQELECDPQLAVVLKKSGRHFSPEEAAEYIGGYLIFNGITARDMQRSELKLGGFGFSEGMETFCPLGPWIVTADEIPDPHNLAISVRVNGELRQSSHSSKMSLKVPDLLAYCSPMGCSAGDVVCTGTTSSADETRQLRVGDVMECEIGDIGILRNRVISWKEAYGDKPIALATQETPR